MVIAVIVGYLIDLGTKTLAINKLADRPAPSFLGGWLSFPLVYNPGAAFSMGESITVVFTAVSIIALVAAIVWGIWKVRTTLMAWVVALLVIGVSGNLTDRLFRPPKPFFGHVVDFISVKHFAVFNFADICITLAALCWIVANLKAVQNQPPARQNSSKAEANQ